MLRTALLTGPALAAFLLALPAASGDVPRQVRLDYERQEGASGCPDEATIRTGVAARLGYEPFRERADDRLRTTIRQTGKELEARIELRDAQGKLRAERRLVSHGRDCAELASSVELAIAIAIDPMASGAPAAPETPAPSAAPAPAAREAETVTVPADEPSRRPTSRTPLESWLGVALLGGAGFAPGPNAGLIVGGGLASSGLSLGLEARADLPAGKELRTGEATAQLLAATLVPCLHLDRAAVCALASAGVRRVGSQGLVDPHTASLTYVGLGGRVGLALPLHGPLSLTLHGDVIAPLTKNRLTVDDQVVWTSPPVAVALAAGVAMRFP